MRDDAAEQPRHDPVEHFESAPHHPEGAVALTDVVRDHAHLDAGTSASSQARRTPKPSIASTRNFSVARSEPVTYALVAIGRTTASGSTRLDLGHELHVGPDAVDDRDLGAEVAVEGLRADDDGSGGESPAAGDSDVDHCTRLIQGKLARDRRGRLDRSHAADEPSLAAELELGRGDQQDLVFQQRVIGPPPAVVRSQLLYSVRILRVKWKTGWRGASTSHSSSLDSRPASKNGRVTRPSW